MSSGVQTKMSAMDFDARSALAVLDPESFETMRQSAIEELISRAPRHRQWRLRSLQWRIDQERRAASTPLGACVRISRMMWERIMGRHGLMEHLQNLDALSSDRASARPDFPSARVIRLHTRSRKNPAH